MKLNPKETLSKLPKWVWDPGMAVVFLLFTAAVLMFYVLGPAMAQLHSDFTDSLLWANITAETGHILDPNFNYAAILPFGAPFWMVPILKIFGYGRTAYILSNIIFVVIFMAGAYFMLRSMKWSRTWAAAGTMTICLILSSSANMLEMMWAHAIYYSLSILFWMVLLGLTLRLTEILQDWKKGDKIKLSSILLLAAMLILCIGIATDGTQVLALTVAPMAAALVAVAFFGENPLLSCGNLKKYALILAMGVATVAGMVLLKLLTRNGKINADYAAIYSNWSRITEWPGNFVQMFPYMAQLFGVDIGSGEKLFTLKSVVYVLKMVYLLVIIFCPVALLIRYRKLRESTRLALWAHLVVATVLFLGYVCGMLHTAEWRLIPFIGTGTVVLLAWLRELWGGKTMEKRLSAALAVLMAVICLANVVSIARMPRGVENNRFWDISQALKAKGYTHGYSTFWYALPVNLLSDGEVKVTALVHDDRDPNWPLMEEDGKPVPKHYQNYKTDFDPVENEESCFLLLSQPQLESFQQSQYQAWLKENRNLIDSFQCGDFYVLVFDGHIIP